MRASNRTIFFAAVGNHGFNVNELKSAILQFYQDVGTATVRITESQDILLLSIDHINRPFKNTTQLVDNNIHIACPYPLINFIDSPEKANGIDNRYLYEFIEKIETAEIDSAPPYCYAAHDYKNNSLKIGTDFLGFGKVYKATENKVEFFASHQAVLAFALDKLSVNEDYWHQYLTWSFPVDDSTPFKNIELLEPGAKLQFKGTKGSINIDKGLVSLLKKQRDLKETSETLLTKAEAACRRQLRNGILLSDKIGSVGLSGGRDSRLIMSLVMAERLSIKCHTGYPPNAEVDIAKRLVEASEQKIEWKAIESKGASAPDGGLLERAKSAFFKYEGDSWPSPVRKGLSALKSDRIASAVFISGGAGEVARSHFYTEKDLDNPQLRLSKYLKFVENANTLIPKHARKTTSIQMRQIMSEGSSAGLKGLELLDYFFIRSRIRRAYPTNINTITPIFNIEMLLHAFSIPLKEKLRAASVTELTKSLKPEWGGTLFE